MSFLEKTAKEKVQIIEKRLQDEFEAYQKYIDSSETLEVNLGKDRTENEKANTLEARLDNKRGKSSDESVVEKLLDKNKKNRCNISGNTPLLEKKRLENDPIEKQKTKKAHK